MQCYTYLLFRDITLKDSNSRLILPDRLNNIKEKIWKWHSKLANLAGRLLFITAYAANKKGLSDTPEANILAGSASALGDIAEGTTSVEAQRGAVISGLAAVEHLLPKLTIKFIAEGQQYLEAMLASPHGLTHQDVIDVLERKWNELYD